MMTKRGTFLNNFPVHLLVVSFLFTTAPLFAQTSNREIFRRSILEDLKQVNQYYSAQIYTYTKERDTSVLEIANIIQIGPLKEGVIFYKVTVRFGVYFHLLGMNDSLHTYYFVEGNGDNIYPLFGFMNSSILLWIRNCQLNRDGKYKEVEEIFMKAGIWDKEQVRYLIQSLRNESPTLSPKFNYPCNILRYYFPKDQWYKIPSFIVWPEIEKTLER